ncbi:neurogenic locus notch homolog protein 4-like [Stylophora pistillata]|uniref:neurogenic locus notch homolog protein 4-like n=1 Tax=Stylophora pistillata TaxID=50429 RepID=UPI000C052CA5|nr:neurogenic locus notch homolog protein 4-like [Stylophora pistillata]
MLEMAGKQTSFFIVLFLLSQVLHNIASQQCGADSDLYSIYQMMLKGYTFKTFKFQPGTLECREACLADVRCQSYNVVMFVAICELNNRTKEARPEDFVKDKDRYYMAKKSRRVPLGSIPELPADSCKEIKAIEDHCIKHRCQNDAKCVNGHVNYTCECNSSGWTGNYCEQDVNECADEKPVCDGNAECNNILGSFNYTCKDGFSGNGSHCTDR